MPRDAHFLMNFSRALPVMTTFLIEGVRAFAFEDVEDLVFGEVQILHLDRLDTCFGFEHKEAAAAAGMGGDGFQVQAGQGETHGKSPGAQVKPENATARALASLRCRKRGPRCRYAAGANPTPEAQSRMMPRISWAALGML